MANLPETPQWQDGIYQIETSDPVLGGPDGISNRQAKQLASRTAYLKQQQEKSDTALDDHIADADPHKQYAPKASPTFTGTPTAPTAVQATNNTQIATTAFVQANVSSLKGGAPADMDTLKKLADGVNSKLTKDQNLSDLTNKSAARGALELGTAATKDVGVAGGNVMAVGAFGLGIGPQGKDDAYSNVAQFYHVNASSANKPPITGNIAAGVISLPCDAAPSTGYVAVSGNGDAYIGSSNAPANGVKWSRAYTTAYKPTADDVGAITRSDAPVGIPQPWPTGTAPSGWLKCNGATFDKAKYPLLAVAYPSGKLPDLRGEFIRGLDDGRRVDVDRQLLSWQPGTLVGGKDDNTDGGDISYLANGSSVNYGSDAVNAANYPGIVARYASTGAQINPATPTYNFFSVTRPRNIAFNYIVRAA
uniref:tail fiber protein n=1 Tax=Serratia quinivorans TaxID=137545 RepID=UPI0035C744C7